MECSGKFSHIPAKINIPKPNLAKRNYVSKEIREKIWTPIACVMTTAPHDHTANSTSPHVRFLSAYYKIGRQSVRFLPNENDHRFLSASNHEIQMLMLVYAHRQNSRFIHVGGGDRKSAIFGDGVDNEAYRLQRKIRFARKEH